MSVETSISSVLAIASLGLLLAVTGGVAYLTTVEWRDRRRREREQREIAKATKTTKSARTAKKR